MQVTMTSVTFSVFVFAAVTFLASARAISVMQQDDVTVVDFGSDNRQQNIILLNVPGVPRPLKLEHGMIREMSDKDIAEFKRSQADVEARNIKLQQQFNHDMRGTIREMNDKEMSEFKRSQADVEARNVKLQHQFNHDMRELEVAMGKLHKQLSALSETSFGLGRRDLAS